MSDARLDRRSRSESALRAADGGPSIAVRQRLPRAWREEILASRLYELIAARMPAREAEILRRMSQAEAGRRERLEGRMRELGIEVPAPTSVHMPVWRRMQARIAPVDRLLAAAEAAEDEAVEILYQHATGDSATDALLSDLREEERSHSNAIKELRGVPVAPPPAPAQESAPAPAQVQLDTFHGREKSHRNAGGWISDAI